MVSKQYTNLALLLPVAMIIGNVISIYIIKNSAHGSSFVIVIGSLLLIVLLFFVYKNMK